MVVDKPTEENLPLQKSSDLKRGKRDVAVLEQLKLGRHASKACEINISYGNLMFQLYNIR